MEKKYVYRIELLGDFRKMKYPPTPHPPLKELEIHSEDFYLLGRVDTAQEKHLCTTRGKKTFGSKDPLNIQIS